MRIVQGDFENIAIAVITGVEVSIHIKVNRTEGKVETKLSFIEHLIHTRGSALCSIHDPEITVGV